MINDKNEIFNNKDNVFSNGGINLFDFIPKSLTLSFYDVSENIYGFTFNTHAKPIEAVIKIKKDSEKQWNEYTMRTVRERSYDESGEIEYYISKTEIKLEENSTYTYYAYDKGAEVGTARTILRTKSPHDNRFLFAHLSDSQGGPNEFGQVLAQIVDVLNFIIYTGDVVETSKYEKEWKEMLDTNYKSIGRIPIMAISGNHETTYKSGLKETFKHFNHMIPTQNSIEYGYFYSFVYGDVKFIMLNTNDLSIDKLKAEQYKWLIRELEENDCKWTIVSVHNPLYSPGKYGSNSSRNKIALALQEQLQSVFVQYGVDLVLQGHDHVISRTYPIDSLGNATSEVIQVIDGLEYTINPAGVIYLENGPAGNQMREIERSYDSTLYKYAQGTTQASWAEIEVDNDLLVVTVKGYDGSKENIYHQWGIMKGGFDIE